MTDADPTRLVIDTFLVIGHIAAVCKFGGDLVGFEIDPEYFDEARRLIQRAGKSP